MPAHVMWVGTCQQLASVPEHRLFSMICSGAERASREPKSLRGWMPLVALCHAPFQTRDTDCNAGFGVERSVKGGGEGA